MLTSDNARIIIKLSIIALLIKIGSIDKTINIFSVTCYLNEDAVVDLAQTEQLQHLAWLGRDAIDTAKW